MNETSGDTGAPTHSAADMEIARRELEKATGIPDAFRYGPIVTLTRDQLRERYPRRQKWEGVRSERVGHEEGK